jgi:hypothetical protein
VSLLNVNFRIVHSKDVEEYYDCIFSASAGIRRADGLENPPGNSLGWVSIVQAVYQLLSVLLFVADYDRLYF